MISSNNCKRTEFAVRGGKIGDFAVRGGKIGDFAVRGGTASRAVRGSKLTLAVCAFLLLQLLCVSPVRGAVADSFYVAQISDSLFALMKGKSYPAGCKVARSQLRYVHVYHYDNRGKVHEGELVCNKAIALDLLDIFRQLFIARYPIEKIRLIDEYGGDDGKSMRDNNSSCFCYRVTSGFKVLSKHAQGLAVDINTFYNPCVRKTKKGTVVQPSNAGVYCDRTKSFPYKIEKGDLCYELFKKHGFKWGGEWRSVKDYQHFEK